MNLVYILFMFLLVTTSYEQNIFPEHKRRQCNKLQTSGIMEQILPEIRRYFLSESQSSRRQHEEIIASLKEMKSSLHVFQTEVESIKIHNDKMNASLRDIQAELETNRQYQQGMNTFLGTLQAEMDSRRRQNEEINATLEVVQSELETTKEHLSLLIQGCEGDWVYHSGYCYLFSQTSVNYEGAKVLCQHEDAYVADVRNEMEHQFIKAELNKIENQNALDYYLGGYYKRAENTWIWERTGETIEFTRWNAGEPNDSSNQEDCLFILHRKNRLWNDATCRRISKVICKKSIFS